MIKLQISVGTGALLTFDKKALKKTMRQAGAEVAAVARALIRRSQGGGRFYYKGGKRYQASAPGQPPGSVSGDLARSIKVSPFRSGQGVTIRDTAFYALFLEKGAQGGGRKGGKGARNRRGKPQTARVLLPRPVSHDGARAAGGLTRDKDQGSGAAGDRVQAGEGVNVDGTIAQLKAYAAVFNGNVAGAAEYARAVVDQVWLPYPAAYVVPLDEEAEPNDEMNALRQVVLERVGVIVVFDNSADRRGQTVTELYDSTRASIWGALLNYRLDPVKGARGLEYIGGRLLDHDRARLFYQWDFGLRIMITDADGFQVPTNPLTEIDATFQKSSTTEDYAEAVITPPQT